RRVLRGGCWNSKPDECRSSYRLDEIPAFTDVCFGKAVSGFVGIRCVRRRETGDRETGYRGTGYRGTGYRGTGYRETGYRETGRPWDPIVLVLVLVLVLVCFPGTVSRSYRPTVPRLKADS
ncbi:MAG: hypothetical protein WBF17_19975, partial [Phycisphaerae bacterium]